MYNSKFLIFLYITNYLRNMLNFIYSDGAKQIEECFMNEIQLILGLTITFLPFVFLLRYIMKQEIKRKWLIMVMGALFWLFALLARLIPLGMIQVFELISHGFNITNPTPAEIEAMKQFLATDPVYILFSVAFAGIFEETFRYILFSLMPSSRERHLSALVVGTGWTLGEIFFLYVLPMFSIIFLSTDVPYLNVILGAFERWSASIIHISLTFLVFWSLKERFPKFSLLLAILLHALFDAVAVFGMIFFGSLIPSPFNTSLTELIIFVSAVIVAIFVFKQLQKRGYNKSILETIKEIIKL